MEHLMQKIDVPETERIVFFPDNYGSNMSLKYGYSNIGFFTSARNRDTLKAMYRLGYNVQRDEELWMTSYSGTFLNYSMAGVKYYITKGALNDKIYGFELNEQYQDFYIYENKNNFNIGYYLSNNVEESYNPFKIQNDLLNGLVNDNEQNIEYFQNIDNSNVLECEENLEYNDETQEYTVKYKVKALNDCTLYLQSDYNLQLYIDNQPQFEDYSNIWSTETGIKQIKHLNKDETFEFVITTKQNLELMFIYVSDNNAIQEVMDNMNTKNYFSDIKINSDGLQGTAYFEDDGFLVFAINYDSGWKIYVDGQKIPSIAIGGAFLGVKLEKGVHDVEIIY